MPFDTSTPYAKEEEKVIISTPYMFKRLKHNSDIFPRNVQEAFDYSPRQVRVKFISLNADDKYAHPKQRKHEY